MGALDSITLQVGTRSLDALWKRSNAISDNISNDDTPGYHEKSVSFENQLVDALSDNKLDEAEVSGLSAQQTEAQTGYSADGSGVDMESQLIELTRNQLQYNYMVRAVSDNLSLLRTAATEGKK